MYLESRGKSHMKGFAKDISEKFIASKAYILHNDDGQKPNSICQYLMFLILLLKIEAKVD